jgi:hypothetical protein
MAPKPIVILLVQAVDKRLEYQKERVKFALHALSAKQNLLRKHKTRWLLKIIGNFLLFSTAFF